MNPAGDREAKRRRIRDLLDERGLDAVQLTSAAALGWYLEGARVHVGIAAAPIVAVEATGVVDRVLVTSNEAARLVAEELPDDVEVITRRWFDPVATSIVPESELEVELRAARQAFLPEETARFRRLGRDAAVVLTDALRPATPRETERGLAARIAAGVVGIGADPVVVLVAGESRLAYRHPLPTGADLGDRAMVVLCARRDGLIVNLTRWVRFGAATAEEHDRDARIREVEADILRATIPGVRLRDVLEEIRIAYPRHGFDAEEWLAHHQGGPAGYAGRDPRATPDADDLVVAGQFFTWNPSAPGTKIEDTVRLGADGIQPVTVDPRWPPVTGDGPRP
ncbi:M24 family metallopeptidase, partial [Pseudolysinimonas sp.]|uniref:M24 family metallopeptidase n=1 Tax=Pseudolysinimonas sp. TaxID=2680009 RepID=UPI003F7D1F91